MKLNHEEWLAERQKSIGGSDAAAIVGLNSYVTPYTVWADKTGRLPPKDDNEAMRQGRDLEQYVADRFTEASGKRVRRRTDMMHNPAYPFAHANIDRAVVGERAGLECKTTSIMNLKKFKSGNYPENYYVQCVHYLAVTGWNRWYLAVLVLNQGFYWYTIDRDEDEIAALLAAEKEFFNTYIIPGVPPPLDGRMPTSQALQEIYGLPDLEDETKPLYCINILEDYFALKQQNKALEIEKRKCEQIIQQELGESISGLCAGYKITWKPQQRRTFQIDAFAKDHPEIPLDEYFKVSSFRQFTVKECKEK